MSDGDDIGVVRNAMAELDRLSASSPDRAPKPEEIFNPLEHRNALDMTAPSLLATVVWASRLVAGAC